MNFFFLRHTSLNIGKDIFYVQTDIDVSEIFNTELKNLKGVNHWSQKVKV